MLETYILCCVCDNLITFPSIVKEKSRNVVFEIELEFIRHKEQCKLMPQMSCFRADNCTLLPRRGFDGDGEVSADSRQFAGARQEVCRRLPEVCLRLYLALFLGRWIQSAAALGQFSNDGVVPARCPAWV